MLERACETGSDSTPTWKPKSTKPSKALVFAAKVFTWMETFLWIRTKDARIVPFRMNVVQQILAQYVAERWHKALPVKATTPKSRQQGSSTFWQLLFFTLCELKPGFRVGVVAHDDTGAKEVFSRAHTALRQIKKRKEWPEPELLQMQDGYVLWETESSMQSATIRTGDSLGKGGTPSAVHFSEPASFSDKGNDARKAVNSILNAVPENRWTIFVYESTAKGKDPFFWPLCEGARDPSSGSDVQLIFLPWFLTPEYAMPWAEYRRRMVEVGNTDPGEVYTPWEEETALRNKLARVKLKPEEKWYRYKVDLTDEQLIWYRWILTKCSGDRDERARYYPSHYEECFTASASCLFEPATVDWYRQHGRKPTYVCEIVDTPGGPAICVGPDNASDPVKVWEDPLPDEEYVIGGDPGGEKKNSDPSCLYVMKRENYEVVAMVHGHFEWDEFADIAFNLGMLYNRALLAVENNHQSAIVKRLHRRDYPNLYYHQDIDRAGKAAPGRDPGFNTNKKTRPAILKVLAQACRARMFICPDPDFWEEMENMVWVPRSTSENPDREGEYRAVGGNHDDRIMAAAIAIYLCPKRDFQMRPEEPVLLPSRAVQWYQKIMREDEEFESETYVNLSALTPKKRITEALNDARWYAEER